jgi:hypothetical protein
VAPTHRFGEDVAAATSGAPTISTSPFPAELRRVVGPHVQKAAVRRQETLNAIRTATGAAAYDAVMCRFNSGLAHEGHFAFHPSEHPLREAFLASGGQPASTDLCNLHRRPGAKDALLRSLTQRPAAFQAAFDAFVRKVCAPQMAAIFDCDEIYYQAFPCVRVVQPDEFSIGPHADVSYVFGFHCLFMKIPDFI